MKKLYPFHFFTHRARTILLKSSSCQQVVSVDCMLKFSDLNFEFRYSSSKS